MGHRLLSGITLMVVAVLARPAAAHHSTTTQYDQTTSVVLRGVMVGVDWRSPHVYLHVDVTDNGSTATWTIEYVGPQMLYRAGWKKDSIKPGEVVSIQAMPARNGATQAYLRMLTTGDGRRFGSDNGTIVASATAREPQIAPAIR